MIKKLQITNFRNLKKVKIQPNRCNVFIGQNGSGKTSLLESLFLVSRGKSFRTHQPKRYIQHHKDSSTVFIEFDSETTLAIQKNIDATTLLKFNGNAIKTQSQLTKYMPTLLIDPTTMDILEQGSSSRRQILDWVTFHVKPGFHQQWLAYQRLLKQRNSLLKQIKGINYKNRSQILAWDVGLSSHASLIHHYRENVFSEWLPYVNESLRKLLPQYSDQVLVSYQPGFDVNQNLEEILAQKLEQDVCQGYTRVGSHRADISVSWKSSRENKIIKEQAVNFLSRGEKKLLITALRLSQLPLLNQIDYSKNVSHETNISVPIILLDDITAELDTRAINILLSTLSELSCQVFITSLTEDILPKVSEYWSNYKVFQVEHGEISSL